MTINQAVRPMPSKWRRLFVALSGAGAAHGQRGYRRNHGLFVGVACSAGQNN